MKAWTYAQYGGVEQLSLSDLPEPTAGPGQVLVAVHAVGLNASDWEFLTGKPAYARIFGLFRPGRAVLGSDIAGTVRSVGDGVEDWSPGDAVFCDAFDHWGGFAAQVVVPAERLLPLPAGVDMVAAAATPQAAVIALAGIVDDLDVQAGHAVLINGAGGDGGTFAVQLAVSRGATVTAVDRAEKLDLLRELGAHRVLEFATTDWATEGQTYDRVLDLWGTRSAGVVRRALKPDGRYRIVGGPLRAIFGVLLDGALPDGKRRSLRVLAIDQNAAQLRRVAELLEDGTLRPAVDRTFPFEELPAAMARLGAGQSLGKLVVTLDPDPR